MLPIEIIIKIFSYYKHIKCYRCNKYILPHVNFVSYNTKTFCDINCIEYQHY